MQPIKYYERTETTEDGFTVHCGWYKLTSRTGRTAYTNGEVYGCDHLNIWLQNKESGTWYKIAMPLYGKDFAPYVALSSGKIAPVSWRRRIDDGADGDALNVAKAKYTAWASKCVEDREEVPDDVLPDDLTRLIYAYNDEDGQQLARKVFCEELRSMGYAAEPIDTNNLEIAVTLADGREVIYLVDVN